jgi:BirA family biotin operon repressor/biotin-[acetyl-CoA-carboxylase] ligase
MKQHLKETASTNAWLMALARERMQNGDPLPDLYAVYADFQSAGRGAGTNRWHSTRGLNILISIYVETGLAAADQFVFNLWFAITTRLFLARYVPDVLVKWPNDMYVNNRKLAGDLTEHNVVGGCLAFTVAGIGINVNEMCFPDEIPNPTSLFLETGIRYDVDRILEEYLALLRERRPLLNTTHATELRNDYLAHLYRRDEPHPYLIDGQRVIGIIRDIDRYGRLILEHPDGTRRSYGFKEVAYEI